MSREDLLKEALFLLLMKLRRTQALRRLEFKK